MNTSIVSHRQFRIFGYALFDVLHAPKDISHMVVDGLVDTSLRGVDSHGVRLIPHYLRATVLGRINKSPKFTFKKTAASTGIVDADHGWGIAAGTFAMEKAITLAKRSGIGAVAVKNSSHFGAAALYGIRAARAGMIGMAFTHVESLVFPFRGKKPYLGTNPICFCAPVAGEDPFCLDMATSQIPWNKVMMYRGTKQQLEPGWAGDRQGKPTTDPDTAIGLLPIGLYKGYGLALMVEILCSMLSGMAFGSHIKFMFPLDGEKRKLGHFFMAIDISSFTPLATFKRRMKQLLDELRAVPSITKDFPVLVAGDPEKTQYNFRSKKGIPLAQTEIESFRMIANELGVAVPSWLR